jgi:hypothetical protein
VGNSSAIRNDEEEHEDRDGEDAAEAENVA